MPKDFKESSGSESDIIILNFDRHEPPGKKSKMDSRTNDIEPTWVLQGKKLLVKIRECKGKVSIDIREFYEKNGDLLPGEEGISLSPDMWRKLLSLGDEINEAISSYC